MVNFIWKDNSKNRRGFLGWTTAGLGAIISSPVRWPIRVWPVTVIAIVIVVAGLLMVSQTQIANAADEQATETEDCLRCHSRTLSLHDKLGSGNKACWACHDKTDMKMLHLVDGTRLLLSESPQLCGQCHQERYGAWKEGTHGLPGIVATVECTSCHDPHQPQIALLNITKPHPEAQPDPSPPSVELMIMLGTVVLLTIAVTTAVVTRGKRP